AQRQRQRQRAAGVKLYSRLPKDRTAEGALWVVGEDDRIQIGPERCRGKSDNQTAIAHGNPSRDPLRPFGDHPLGTYRVTSVRRSSGDPERWRHYGPAFLALEPVAGDALKAAQDGRTDLGIHGGLVLENGQLRPTFGCLRVLDDFDAVLADLVEG